MGFKNKLNIQALSISVLIHIALFFAFLYQPTITPQKQHNKQVEVQILSPVNKHVRVKKQYVAAQPVNRTNILHREKSNRLMSIVSSMKDSTFVVRDPNDLLSYTQDLKSRFNFNLDKIEKGNITLLNSDYSLYASFYERISGNIMHQWLKSVSEYLSDPVIVELLKMNKSLWNSRIEITLDKNGNFLNAIVVNSSGSIPLDKSATDAFKIAAPFVNPPQAMVKEDGKIHIDAMFSIYINQNYYARTKK